MDASATGLISLESLSMTNGVLETQCPEMFRFEQNDQGFSYEHEAKIVAIASAPDGALLNNTNNNEMDMELKTTESFKKQKKSVKTNIKKENSSKKSNSAVLKMNGSMKRSKKLPGLKISSQINLKNYSNSENFLDTFNDYPMGSGKLMIGHQQQTNCGVDEDDMKIDLSMNSSKFQIISHFFACLVV